MPAPRDPELLAKAARLYFLDDRSQDDVAAILGTTRSNVSRMVRQARDLGIVEIRIVAPAQRDHELELALRARYPLADARVLEVNAETEVLAGVGHLAARWLDETLRDGQVVALSWGHSLQAMVRDVDLARRDVEVVQLVGGLSALDSAVTGQELVRELSERIGARHRYLHAPALFGSAEALTLPAASRHRRRAGRGQAGRHGHGRHRRRRHRLLGALLDALALSPAERAFDAAGAVGDVCGRFYDRPAGRCPARSTSVSWPSPSTTSGPSPPWPGSRPGRRRPSASSAPCGAGSSTSLSVTSRRRGRSSASTEEPRPWSFDTCGTSSPSPRSCTSAGRPSACASPSRRSASRSSRWSASWACGCWSVAGGWS